jgi:adenine-specific DNA glycosylase
MELGATVCLPRKPLCLICPLQNSCAGRDRAEEFPVKSRVATVKRIAETVAILKKGKSFIASRCPEGKAVARPLALPRFRSGADGAGRGAGDDQIRHHEIFGDDGGGLGDMEGARAGVDARCGT